MMKKDLLRKIEKKTRLAISCSEACLRRARRTFEKERAKGCSDDPDVSCS